MIVHEASPVRDEGTVVVFEGVHEHEHGIDIVFFAVDRREAAGAAQAAADGLGLLVEPWQVLARMVEDDRPGFASAPPRRGFEGPFEDPRLGEPDPPAWVDRI